MAGLLLCLFAGYAWAGAGRILFAEGDVHAVDEHGQQRTLRRGDEVAQGDDLFTTSGQIQIRFTDGGLIALEPGSRLSIDNYHYAGVPDGTERAAFTLRGGSLRAVTGAIGQDRPDTYILKTPFATIGIDGTSYKAAVCSPGCTAQEAGLYVTATSGVLKVVNQAGKVALAVGQSAYVAANDGPPRRLNAGIPFYAAEELAYPPRTRFQAGEELAPDGTPRALDLPHR